MKAMASDSSMPMLALIGIGLMYGPIRPLTKAIGSSAAITVRVARMVGPPTSSTAPGMSSRQRPVRVQRLVAVDVLDHHDGVVHQDADGEDQREQRHAVEREAPGPGGEQRHGQGQDHGGADDRRLAPAERDEHQRHHRRRWRTAASGSACAPCRWRWRRSCASAPLPRRPGSRVLRSSSTRCSTASATSIAFSPGFLVTAMVTAGILAAACGAGDAVPDVALRRQRRRRAPRATSCRKTGRPSCTPTTSSPTSRASLQERAGLDRDGAVAAQQLAQRRAEVGRLQRLAQVGHGDAGAGHARRVEFDQHRRGRGRRWCALRACRARA